MLAKFVSKRKVRAAVAIISSLMLVMGTAATAGATGAGNGVALDGASGHNTDLSPLSITFYKELCPDYLHVPANNGAGNLDRTGGHYNDLGGQQSDVVWLPAGCKPADGWQFDLGPSIGTVNDTTPKTSGGLVTVDLSADDIALARGGSHLTISEETNDALAGFGALRCTGDIQNGDNEEWVHVGDSVSHVDCVAYNVKQAISFDSVGAPKYGDAPITLNATSTSGLPVTFSSTSPADVCSVSGDTLTILGVGSCSVTASQHGQSSIEHGTPDFAFWSPALDVSQTFVIAQAPSTVTVTCAPSTVVYTGLAQTPCTAQVTSGGSTTDVPASSLTFANNTNAGTVANPTAGASYTWPGDANHAGGTGSATFVISPAVLTVKADNQSMPYEGTVPTLTYGITGYVNHETSAVVSGLASITTTGGSASNVGTYPITVAKGTLSAANYTFIFTPGTLTVEPIGQTITFTKPANVTYGVAPFDLSASSSAGGSVSFSIVSGPCSVSGKTVTVTGVGTCLIEADRAAGGNYTAAAPVQQSFVISPAVLTVKADNQSMPYEGTVPTLTYGITGYVNHETSAVVSGLASITTTGGSASNVGTYPITVAKGTLSAANYTFIFTPGTLTVVKVGQTITFPNPGAKLVNSPDFALTATASSNLTVAYKVNSGPCTVTGSTVHLNGSTGTCSITASQPGDDNYTAATSVTKTFSVGKVPQTITFLNPGNKMVDSPKFALGATTTSPLTVAYKVDSGPCTVDAAGNLTVTGAGICIVTASQPGDDVYAPALNVTRIFAVLKYDQSITFNKPADVTFGVPPFKLDAAATSGLPITYYAVGKCTVSGDMVTVTGVGNCAITATQPGDDHWNAAFPPVIRTFAIGKADQTITFGPLADVTYGAGTITLTATASSGLPVSYTVSGKCSVSGSTLTITGVGSCTVTAAQPGNANFNAAASVSQSFNIGMADSTVTVLCPVSVVFTGAPQTAACTASAIGPGMSSSVNVTGSIVFTDNGGKGTATASAHWDGDANHNPSDGHTTFEIVLNGSKVTVECASPIVYTGSAITSGCTATVTGDGMATFTFTATDPDKHLQMDYIDNLNVGTATVTASWAGSATNGGDSGMGHFAITPADLTIKANDQTMAVGDTTFALGHINFTPTGLLAGDHVTSVDLASPGANPTTDKGSYPINIDGAAGTGLGNYTIAYVKGTLTVTDKYVLTVTAYDKTRDYKKANPDFTFHISGYQDGDDPSVVTTLPTCSTTATIASLPGSYHITCTGADAAAGKYAFNFVDGTLKITGNVVGGVTGTPATTATRSNPANSDAFPLFALLICAAFGGLGLLAVQAQRKSTRA